MFFTVFPLVLKDFPKLDLPSIDIETRKWRITLLDFNFNTGEIVPNFIDFIVKHENEIDLTTSATKIIHKNVYRLSM